MRTFAAAYPQLTAQQAVAQLPWGHVTVLLDKLERSAQRDWYTNAAVQYGWSRNVLTHQITNQLHNRASAAPSHFADRLPAADSELAEQLTRNPYVLSFLDLTGPATERDLETAEVNELQASCSSSATVSRSSAGNTTARSTTTTSTSVCCSSTGCNSASSSWS